MTNKNTNVQYQTLVVIWAALLTSQLLFVLLIYFSKPELLYLDTAASPLGDQPLVILVFALAAIIMFALSFVFRRQHFRRAVADQDVGCVQTGLILACALCEACSLLGLVLAFVFEYPYFFVWIGLGFFGILLHFPRRNDLESARYKMTQ